MATVRDFQRMALSLPEATQGAHGGHPDFRVGNKVFASLGVPDESWGMVKLTPEQQERAAGGRTEDIRARRRRLGPPRLYAPAPGRHRPHDAAERAHHGMAQHGAEKALLARTPGP